MTPEVQKGLLILAARLGIQPVDLLTIVFSESGGDPNKWFTDPKTGKTFHGLIQLGEEERKRYGLTPGMPLAGQLAAMELFLKKRGVQPGMNRAQVYSTIQAGSPGHMNARDTFGMSVQDRMNSRHMQESYAQALNTVGAQSANYTPPVNTALALAGVPPVPAGTGANAPGATTPLHGSVPATRGMTPPAATPAATPAAGGTAPPAPPAGTPASWAPYSQAQPGPTWSPYAVTPEARGSFDEPTATPGFIKYNIQDRTAMEGVRPEVKAALEAMAAYLQQAGGTGLTVTAGKGEGHLSHMYGTEVDVTGQGPGGVPWSPEMRLAALLAARNVGANRFGLYQSANLPAHVGFGGPGLDQNVTWGMGGLTSGPESRAYARPDEVAFSKAVMSQTPYAFSPAGTPSYVPPLAPPMNLNPPGTATGPPPASGGGSFTPPDTRPLDVATGAPMDWSGIGGALGRSSSGGASGGASDNAGGTVGPLGPLPGINPADLEGPPTPPGMTALIPKAAPFEFDPNTIGSFARLMAARSANPYRA